MTEEENPEGVIEAVAQPSESVEEQDDQQEETKQNPSQVMSDKEFNWSEARRKISELERRTQEQENEIRGLKSNGQFSDDKDFSNLDDEEIVTAKQVREALRRQEASTLDERLRLRFPDFDTVITKENVDLLQQQDPELALSLKALSHDPYAQAVAAYKLLKRTGVVDMASKQPQKAKAIENSRKPVSVQSVTKSSAIAEANKFQSGLTPELRKQLWKEMQESIKSA